MGKEGPLPLGKGSVRSPKPSTIALQRGGLPRRPQAGQRPKIADLGLAKNPDNSLTPAYIAPEQITDFKSADGRAYQYALAYQFLSGRLPFESDQENSVILLQRTQEPSPPPGGQLGVAAHAGEDKTQLLVGGSRLAQAGV